MNGTVVKNQLIFDFAAGTLGYSKSIFASTYLYLNSKASMVSDTFEDILGENLFNNDDIKPKNLKYKDCMIKSEGYVSKNTKDIKKAQKKMSQAKTALKE